MTAVSLLCSEVGRGHPFYLDGLARALAAEGRPAERRAGAPDLSFGLARLAWRAVRGAYRIAGRSGAAASLYARLRGRTDPDGRSPLLRLLGRDLRRWAGREGLVVVDHPLLVGALGGRADVWYVHGELAAPREAIVRRAARVLVPTDEVAGRFAEAGVGRETLVVTGLCVEAELAEAADETSRARRARIAGPGPLTLGLFSSGAEPEAHVAALVAAAGSAARAGHRCLVFAARGGRLERRVAQGRLGAPGAVETLPFAGREVLDRITLGRFRDIDVVVAPPHERSNWAVGLRVPFFLVGPDVGPFAPLNRALLHREEVAIDLPSLDAARELGSRLDEARRSGALLRIANGRPLGPLDGFRRAARAVLEVAGTRPVTGPGAAPPGPPA